MIITGIGELTRGELAGERMYVAYSERSQEDEHSCFSDNTTNDLIGNASGIADGAHRRRTPATTTGPGLLDAVRRRRRGHRRPRCRRRSTASLASIEAIPAPFDQHLADGVSDDDPGRASVLTAIDALEAQATALVAAADTVGVTVEI